MVLPFPDPSRSPRSAAVPVAADEALCIDCDECVLQDTEACQDCVVTFLLGTAVDQPVVVQLAEARALRLFDEAGLAPPLRHRTG